VKIHVEIIARVNVNGEVFGEAETEDQLSEVLREAFEWLANKEEAIRGN
jgi:hypothetical protein